MDDARIKELTEEVFRQLRGPAPAGELEQRVAALEKAVREMTPGSAPHASAGPVVASTGGRQASAATAVLRMISSPEGEGCVLEPGKPCTGSGRCRSFGH
jgi:Zn-dependent M28 family amino/carboxypeptidase